MEPLRPLLTNTSVSNSMVPALRPNNGVKFRNWVNNKLNEALSRYCDYDEGMQMIRESIEQEFAPPHRGMAMKAISKELRTMSATLDTEKEIWSRWQHKQTSEYNSRASKSVQWHTEISGIAGTMVQDEIHGSDPDGAEMSQNRDLGRPKRLSIPAFPQIPSKAKLIYDDHRSPNHKYGPKPGNVSFHINSQEDVGNYTPPRGTSHMNTPYSEVGSSGKNNSASMRNGGEPDNITATTKYNTFMSPNGLKKVHLTRNDDYPFNNSPNMIHESHFPINTSNHGGLKFSHIEKEGSVSESLEFDANYKSLDERRSVVPLHYGRDRADAQHLEINSPAHDVSRECDTLVGSNVPVNEDHAGTYQGRLRYLQSPKNREPYIRLESSPSPSSTYSMAPDNCDEADGNDVIQPTRVPSRSYTGNGPSDYNPYKSTFREYQLETSSAKPYQPKYLNDGRESRQIPRKDVPNRGHISGYTISGVKPCEAPANQGVTKDLPNYYSPSPSLSTSFRITSEVRQEEETDSLGKFNYPTFAAHIPPFGKNSMEEIQKVHAKGDNKSAFLKSIRGAVYDGMNIALKNPMRSRGRPSDKMVISAPMHNGNPLQLSGSRSASDMLRSARPIPGAPPIRRSPVASFGEASGTSVQRPIRQTDSNPVSTSPELDTASRVAYAQLDRIEYTNEPWANGFESAVIKATLDSNSPAISIGPFQQSGIYSYIECSVAQACSDFLTTQQTSLNLNHLKKEVKKWKRQEIKLSDGTTKRRESPVNFMFGLELQCRLLEGNHKALTFAGPAKMNPLPTLNLWKQIIPTLSPQTFSLPDYVVLDHFRMVERIFQLLGEGYWNKALFEKKRSQAIIYITKAGEARKDRDSEDLITKLQRQRVDAETDLLREVGVLSSEQIQPTIDTDGADI